MEIIMENMWADFNDFSLVMLAMRYGIVDEIEFDARGLMNREHLENRLTEIEHEIAFGE